jgi:hypothetical protein
MYGAGGASRCCSFWLFSGGPVRGSSMFEEGLFLLLFANRIIYFVESFQSNSTIATKATRKRMNGTT